MLLIIKPYFLVRFFCIFDLNIKTMKLKSTQLRRYNRVLHNGIEKTIECIAPAGVMFREDCPDENTFGKWVDLDEVEFIPLTEEWLLKFGFTLDIGVGVWFSTQKHFPIWNAYSGMPYQYTLDNPSHNINISTVHQLQNLYFALTGEELQLK